MLESILLISVSAVALWLAFSKGVDKQKTKDMQGTISDIKKTKELRSSLRNKSIRGKLRNYFKQ